MILLYQDTTKQQKQSGGWFEEDENIFIIFNAVASNYNCLPSELLSLEWKELLFNIQCLKSKSQALHSMINTQNRKKAIIFPNISMNDIVNSL